MKFTLTIGCDNAAFFDDRNEPTPADEIARILETLSATITGGAFCVGDSFTLHDLNGNRVGEAKYTRSRAKIAK